jgi:hypothetical protein
MKTNTDKVIEILQSYRSKKRMIQQLEFELQNPSQISATELLRAMSIGGAGYSTVHSGGISDKTMSVVAHYSDTADRLNIETLEEIKRELRVLEIETSKLELYVSLLDERQARIIRLRDFEGKSWNYLEAELKMSERRLRAHRMAGIAELASMFGFIETIKRNKHNEE